VERVGGAAELRGRRAELPRRADRDDRPDLPGRLLLGDACNLVREPDNRYDRNAFRAEVRGRHIGYLRAHVAEQLAGPLDGYGVRTFTVCGLIRGGSTKGAEARRPHLAQPRGDARPEPRGAARAGGGPAAACAVASTRP
jgi:hypothetical protein